MFERCQFKSDWKLRICVHVKFVKTCVLPITLAIIKASIVQGGTFQ